MLHTKALITKANVQEAGVIDGIIGSSAVVDRMGDIIEQSGWDLNNFKNNPVILWAHNSGFGEDRPPIGKALKVWVEDKGKPTARLMFKVQFDLQDSFAAEIFRKIKDGFLNTVSVGFMPYEWEELDPGNWWGGLKYLKQELLELSVVPVPANPEALIQLNSFAKAFDKRFTPIEEKELFPQVQDNRYKKMIKESKELSLAQVEEEKTDEFKKELIAIDQFKADSFRAIKLKKDDKEYIAVIGQLKDSDAYVEQSYRFKKDTWTEDAFNQFTKAEDGEKDEAVETTEEAKETQVDETESEEKASKAPEGLVTIGEHISQMGDLQEELMSAYGDEDESKGDKDLNAGLKEMRGHASSIMGLCEDMMGTESDSQEEDEEKEAESEQVKAIQAKVKSIVSKAGRVLSSKNEGKLRQASDLLDEVIAEVETTDEETDDDGTTTGGQEGNYAKEADAEKTKDASIDEDEQEDKTVIPYKDLGTEPESEAWDGPGEIAKAEVEDLKQMCAWYDGDNPEVKSSYKLPHHKAESKKAVWRGVAAAMASLLGARGGVNIPESERKGVYNHLKKHYAEFDKEAPDFKMVEDQVLAGLDEELLALALEREEKHMVRLIKRVLENQKEEKKEKKVEIKQVPEDVQVKALEIINLALSKVKI